MEYNKITNELTKKMINARLSAQSLIKRELRCPYCNYKIGFVFSDTKGHFEKKCQKCKRAILFFIHPDTGCDFRRKVTKRRTRKYV